MLLLHKIFIHNKVLKLTCLIDERYAYTYGNIYQNLFISVVAKNIY